MKGRTKKKRRKRTWDTKGRKERGLEKSGSKKEFDLLRMIENKEIK
jgi:hypothetical protein